VIGRKYLFIATAIFEAGTGLFLLAWPRAPLELLAGVDRVSPEIALCARIAGAALLSIGVACWSARNDMQSSAQRGLLIGVFIYDVAAAAILVLAALIANLIGVALWPAVALHAALGIWCGVCLLAKSGGMDGAPSDQEK
jgi:hypothetical protein